MLLRFVILLAVVGSCASGRAAERLFDFSALPEGKPPVGFRSVLTGSGAPGDWKVVLAEAPTAFQPLTPNAPRSGKNGVLAQLSTDTTDERFPALIFTEEVFGDFTFTTKFKCVAGQTDQMAGVVFRYQDPKNYYVVRASGLGNNVRFYKFVNGERSTPIGPELPVARGVWHELTVECRGNQIRCLFNGKEAIPALTDNSFAFGQLGFWTKSDSVSHFADGKVTYTPRETLAKGLVREAFEKKTSLTGLILYVMQAGGTELRVIASRDESLIGTAGTAVEANVIANDVKYFGTDKARDVVMVTLPLHDRNGEPVAAVRVEMKPFPGQTEQNAILRALPVIKRMEQRFKEARDLVE
jgi:hypothetical protein